MKKINFSLCCAALCCGIILGATRATAQPPHEISIHAAGGLSTLAYQLKTGDHSPGLGGNFGIGYTYFFAPRWGIGTGLEHAVFNAGATLPAFSEFYAAHDGVEPFDFRYGFGSYEERQRLYTLNIPLMVHFRQGRFYAALGAKAGLLARFVSKVQFTDLVAGGHYPAYDPQGVPAMYQELGNFDRVEHNAARMLKTAFMLTAEAGMRWAPGNNKTLYVGVYFDYGLNNVLHKPAPEHLLTYNAEHPDNFFYHSLLTSQYAADGTTRAFADRMTPLAAGVKVRFGFALPQPSTVPPDDALLLQEEPTVSQQAETDTLAPIPQRGEQGEERVAENIPQPLDTTGITASQEEIAQRQVEEHQRQEEERARDLSLLERDVDNYNNSQTVPGVNIQAELNKRAAILKRYADIHIAIEGHTCDLGTYAVNLGFGQRRADAAKAYLVKTAIAPERIHQTISKSELEPRVPNTNEATRRQNRRVKIRVLEK